MMQQDTIIREITSIARRRLECYAALADLAQRQKTILVEHRESDLPDNLAGFDPLLLEIMQLDRREETLVGYLEDAPPEVSADLRAEYNQLKSRTAKTARLLRELTIINREMLAGKMEFVNFSLGVVCKIAAEQLVSGPGDNPAILLDSRV